MIWRVQKIQSTGLVIYPKLVRYLKHGNGVTFGRFGMEYMYKCGRRKPCASQIKKTNFERIKHCCWFENMLWYNCSTAREPWKMLTIFIIDIIRINKMQKICFIS